MQGRTTMLSAPLPIKASGMPTSETSLTAIRPYSAGSHLHSMESTEQFQSEYERSYGPFENYHWKNGMWIPIKPSPFHDSREWIAELRDSRCRAQENKARSRGDHFSREHLLQIPSKATVFWEPPSSDIVAAKVVEGRQSRESKGPEFVAFKKPGSAPSRVRHDIMMGSASEINGRHYKDMDRVASVAVQTSGADIRVNLHPAVSCQATQTLRLSDKEISNAINDENEPSGDLVNEITDSQQLPFVSPDRTRLEILRKAKYFDAKDVIMPSAILPRSSSMKSLISGKERENGSAYYSLPPARDRRPRSSMTVTEVAGELPARAMSASHSKLFHATGSGSGKYPDLSASRSVNGDAGHGDKQKQDRALSTDPRKRVSQVLPVSQRVFTISPQSRNNVTGNKGNSALGRSARLGQTWNLLPPERIPLAQSLRENVGKKLTAQTKQPSVQSKERFSAWIDL